MSIQSYIEEQVRESKHLGEPTKNWLMEYSSKATIYSHLKRFRDFLEWQNITDSDLIEQYQNAEDKQKWLKQMGNLVISYYHHLAKEGYNSNTARSATSSVRGFFNSQIAPVRVKRKAIPKPQRAKNEHRFNQNELKKMFYCAGVRDKAVLACGVCLGYGAQDFLSLERKTIEAVIAQAEETNAPYAIFEHSRGKTGVTAFSILTPEAIKSLKAWLDISNKESKWLWHNHTANNHITGQSLNDIIKKLVKKANITTTGQVKFHLLRKFLMSSAVEAGFNAFEVKYLLGKQIPVSDATYLYSLAKSIQEKYPQLYERIRLTGYANNNHTKIEVLEEKLQKQQNLIEGFFDVFTEYLAGKVSKRQAVKRVRSVYTEYGRTLSDKEACEEYLGHSLTDEQYEQFKKMPEYKQFKQNSKQEQNTTT